MSKQKEKRDRMKVEMKRRLKQMCPTLQIAKKRDGKRNRKTK